jgi:hypothetical protein
MFELAHLQEKKHLHLWAKTFVKECVESTFVLSQTKQLKLFDEQLRPLRPFDYEAFKRELQAHSEACKLQRQLDFAANILDSAMRMYVREKQQFRAVAYEYRPRSKRSLRTYKRITNEICCMEQARDAWAARRTRTGEEYNGGEWLFANSYEVIEELLTEPIVAYYLRQHGIVPVQLE